MSLLQVLKVISITTDAKNRVPNWLRGRVTFFSDYDLWQYYSQQDTRLCLECSRWGNALLPGHILRSTFPWLDIMDENLIYPNVHKNCRCHLRRY